MSDEDRFESIEAFVPGAIGEPGGRTFYVQARSGSDIFSLKCEKQQVGQLGRYLTQIASSLGASVPDRDILGMLEPVEPAWAIGEMSVAVDEESKLIVVRAEQIPEPDGPGVESGGDPFEQDSEFGLEVAEFTLTPAQALAFGESAEELMAGGRPPCQLCGSPMDPDGHACPRWN